MKTLDEASLYERVLARLPPDARARLAEPTDADLAPRMHHGVEIRSHVLPAKDNRPVTPSRFLSISLGRAATSTDAPVRFTTWSDLRLLTGVKSWGRGHGLFELRQRPRWLRWLQRRPHVHVARPASRFPELWVASYAFVASAKACEAIRRFEPSVATVAIDCSFSDGTSREAYILDFVGRHYLHDFMRSDVEVHIFRGHRYLQLGAKRVLRDDIPPSVHARWNSLAEDELLVSRELAEQIEELAPRQFRYSDPNGGGEVDMQVQRVRKKRARAAAAAPTSQSPGPDPARVWEALVPHLLSGDLVAAERLLVDALRATPASPYHVAADLRIETPPETVADYFDAFLVSTRRERRVAVVYCEMNAFTINPDEWFCSACGLNADGGRNGYDWLGDFNTSARERLVIRGLEPLQEVFADAEILDRSDEAPFQDARAFAERLVIVKFQRMLQDALPSMHHLDVPLLATAHDWSDHVVEIRPAAA